MINRLFFFLTTVAILLICVTLMPYFILRWLLTGKEWGGMAYNWLDSVEKYFKV